MRRPPITDLDATERAARLLEPLIRTPEAREALTRLVLSGKAPADVEIALWHCAYGAPAQPRTHRLVRRGGELARD